MAIGLVITGFASLLNINAILPAGQADLTGYAPTISQTGLVNAVPAAGTLTLTGFAPEVSAGNNTTLTPTQGTLTFGIVPDLSVTKTPGVGTLALTGQVPTLINPAAQTPPAGTLALQGLVPVVSQAPASTTGTLTLTGYAPLIGRGIIPPAGSLKCTPSATISWNANTEQDLAGYIVYHGIVSLTYFESVDVGNVLFYVWNNLPDGTNYFAVTAYDTASPRNESLKSTEVSTVISGRGYAPTLTIGTPSGTDTPKQPLTGSLAFTGNAQQPIQNNIVTPSAGSLAVTGQPPALVIPSGALTMTGLAPTITILGPLNTVLFPATATLTLQGYVKLQVGDPVSGVLTLTGYAPTVSALTSFTITPPCGTLTIVSPRPFNPDWAKFSNTLVDAGGSPVHA